MSALVEHEWREGSVVTFCRACGAQKDRKKWLDPDARIVHYWLKPPAGWITPSVPALCDRSWIDR